MEITLVPHAGLCNRICAITSASMYVEHHPYVKMKVLWPKMKDCYACFSDLFEQPENLCVEELTGLRDYPATIQNFYIPKLWRSILYDLCIYHGAEHNSDNKNDFDEIVNGKKRIYVYSYSSFNQYTMCDSIANCLRPKKNLENIIAQFTKNYMGG